MKNLRVSQLDFNDLPLWQAVRERELRQLNPGARRIALRHGLSASMAQLIAAQAGIIEAGGAR